MRMRLRHSPIAWAIAIALCTPAMVPPTAAASPRVASRCRSETLLLRTATGMLEGTLRCPDGDGPWPVALLVSGAGPIDRDGNSVMQAEHFDTFRLLADGLAARGIATVRYDKRGVGASRVAARPDSGLRFVTFAQDAAEWVQRLQVDERFTSITVVGHGEGSLVGMLAARAADADGFVSLAGNGRPGADIVSEEFGPRLPIELRADFRRVLTSLAAGRITESVPYELASLLRPSAQAYLVSWFRFDPPTELGRLAIPVLIVQGSSDSQATVRDAQLLNAGQPRADAMVLDGVDHSLRDIVPNLDGSGRPRTARGPLSPQVLEGVASFVAQVRRR